ncbi:MAG: hypothetical protein HYV08_14160 [Deltaproteobacteria bacterium]|nr:hypothetical protein [Deltaproteobacteria bacterium]MBI3079455.1 hypothetical protein [Deltaproteobacteria bacterium]
MDRQGFIIECLQRNPAFRRDVLEFRQRFPPIFALPDILALREVVRKALQHVPPRPAQAWVDDRHFRFACEGWEEWQVVERRLEPLLPGLGVKTVQPWEAGYLHILGETKEAYGEALRALARRWPEMPVDYLVRGVPVRLPYVVDPALVDPERDAIFGPYYEGIKGVLGEAQAEALRQATVSLLRYEMADRMFRSARLYLPIFADTQASDLDWPAIRRLQEQTYGGREEKGEPYETCLAAWDLLTERSSLRRIKDRLRLKSVDAVYKMIQAVYSEVTRGPAAARGRGARRAPRTGLISHLKRCKKCRGGAAVCAGGERLLVKEIGVPPLTIPPEGPLSPPARPS